MRSGIQRPTFAEETILWQQGISHVVGLDEVGRGAFAGPVVAAAVVFPPFCDFFIHASESQQLLAKIHDSKLLSPFLRKQLVQHITATALFTTITAVDVPIINAIGIGKATNQALLQAVQNTYQYFHSTSWFVLVDGFPLAEKTLVGKQKGIIKGDRTSISIAAASILAKVHRDTYMEHLHQTYPAYRFHENKGYGTRKHQQALKNNGLSTMHRTSFRLAKFLN